MEKIRKSFKISSWVVLIFALLSLLRIIVAVALGEHNYAEIPADSPENILMITNAFLLVFSGLCLLPEIYVGIQGLRVAKNLKGSKGHIIWAVILLSFSALSLMGTLIAMVKGGSFSAHGSTLFSTLLELIVYFEYIQYAVAFRKELLTSAE